MNLIEQETSNKERRQIYLLTNPITNVPFYVGKAKCAMTRLGQHLARVKQENKKLGAEISSLKELLLVPKITILENTTISLVDEKEQSWIDKYLVINPQLYNKALTGASRGGSRYYHEVYRHKIALRKKEINFSGIPQELLTQDLI